MEDRSEAGVGWVAEDVRLLAYSVTADRIRAVELGPERTVEHDLGSSTAVLDRCDGLMEELRSPAALSQASPPQLCRFAKDWGRSLLPPQWLEQPPAVGIVVPNWLLHYLPLHVVTVDSGLPLCTASGLTTCSSLTMLLRCLGRSTRSEDPSAEGLVDVFVPEDAAPAGSHLAVAADALGHADLEWRQLAARLLRHAGFDSVDDEVLELHAFADLVSLALSRRFYEFVAIVAHGITDGLDPLASGMLLRQNPHGMALRRISVLGSTQDEDGIPYQLQGLPVTDLRAAVTPRFDVDMLTAGQLELTAHLECQLVALLGCSTGAPRLLAGDQPLSLAEMVLRIGAAAVVAPMWDVTMTAVEAWMTAYLSAWRRDLRSRAEAARLASDALHRSGAPLQDVGCLTLRGAWT